MPTGQHQSRQRQQHLYSDTSSTPPEPVSSNSLPFIVFRFEHNDFDVADRRKRHIHSEIGRLPGPHGQQRQQEPPAGRRNRKFRFGVADRTCQSTSGRRFEGEGCANYTLI